MRTRWTGPGVRRWSQAVPNDQAAIEQMIAKATDTEPTLITSAT
jgi:hypothetical protein